MKKKEQSAELTFIEHLGELRRRIIICLLGVIVCVAIGFGFANTVLSFLTRPFRLHIKPTENSAIKIIVQPDGTLKLANPLTHEAGKKDFTNARKIIFEFKTPAGKENQRLIVGEELKEQFYYFSPLDPFLLRLKAALIVGIMLAIPLILWQAWLFVRPALTAKEQRVVVPVALSALILFPIGAAFAYFFARYALLFLSRYTFPGLEPRIEIFKYLGFLLTMMLSLGIVFETPLIIMLLARLGIVNSRMLSKFRRHIYVGIFIVAAFLTPPDAFTMIALSIPLIVLFEASIWLIKPMEHRQLKT